MKAKLNRKQTVQGSDTTKAPLPFRKPVTLMTFLFIICFVKNGIAQTKIVADISNLRNNLGVCRACLFNNAEAFNGDFRHPVSMYNGGGATPNRTGDF